MKHSAQIVTLSAQRLANGSMPLEPAESRPRPNFPESTVAFPRNDQLSYNTNALHRLFNLAKPQLNNSSHTRQHHAEITQSLTFAALIRLSTTTHNLLTFSLSVISSKNSEKLSPLANKHLWIFLSHSSYASSRM